MTTRLPSFADAILALYGELDAVPADVAIIQPADPFLDMAGEDLRRRIFLTESETGESLCLRPEFTIPVCMDHIASRAGTPRRYGYLGEVFRQHRDGRAEFYQAGIEDLGETDIAAADARSLADAHALVGRVLPGRQLVVTLGDQRVFEAVLAALGLPRGWQKRLARAFGSHDQLQAALDDLVDPPRRLALDGRVAELVAQGDDGALASHVEAEMEKAGLSASAGRTPAEISRRLIEKAELRSVRLSADALTALQRFLSIRVPLGEAPAALDGFSKRADIALGASLDLFAARADAVKARIDADIVYDAAFGRPLDYYTGLVFEIALAGHERPLVGGGRYDRLLTMLGAASPIPGVGFSVWLDRIEAALEVRS